MIKLYLAFILVTSTLILASCATTSKDHLEPTVELVGIQQSASAESALEFDIQLRITNPNDAPLELSGLYYELSLEGIDIVNGTARDIPVIVGFSSETVRVNSATDIINGARFIAHLVNEPEGMVNYNLRVKLGTKSKWTSGKLIEKNGKISLK
ncbi:MAG: LEA type 2 family protein [Coraliomargarita sp.]